jgi:hypothetical protein
MDPLLFKSSSFNSRFEYTYSVGVGAIYHVFQRGMKMKLWMVSQYRGGGLSRELSSGVRSINLCLGCEMDIDRN